MDSALFSLIGFSVAMYITPGPNNVMVAASAANHGIRATMPHMFGIAVGFSVMLALVCAGLGSALVNWPLLLPLFRWVGAAWLVVLAWQIAVAPAPGEGGRGRVLGFIGAAAFQWINPKAWLIAAAAAGEYLSPNHPLPAAACTHLRGLPRRRHAVSVGLGSSRQRRRSPAAFAGTAARVQHRHGAAACRLAGAGVD